MSVNKRDFSPSEKSRIMIVEDHPIFRLGLRELINQEDDLLVCGDAEDSCKAWDEIQRLKPDMVIVDISLNGRDGIDLVKEINNHYNDLPVLVLSMHDESLYAERALHAGAKGYIMKQEASESVVKAIRCVLSGKKYVSENLMRNILNRFIDQSQAYDKSPVNRLTDRELEVFRLIGNGFTTNEIAKKLNLSVKTIGTYRERIKEKLKLRHAAELVKHAVRWVEKI